jgi:hypothetical protein
MKKTETKNLVTLSINKAILLQKSNTLYQLLQKLINTLFGKLSGGADNPLINLRKSYQFPL